MSPFVPRLPSVVRSEAKNGVVALPHFHSLSRRQFLGAAGATAATAALVGTGAVGLATPARAAENGGASAFPMLPSPKPIPIAIPSDDPPPPAPFDMIHWLLPGPEGSATPLIGIPGFGLDVEPSLMTDYRGFTTLAVIDGKATGSDDVTYDVEFDVRVMDGTYIAEDGSRNQGTFAFF